MSFLKNIRLTLKSLKLILIRHLDMSIQRDRTGNVTYELILCLYVNVIFFIIHYHNINTYSSFRTLTTDAIT